METLRVSGESERYDTSHNSRNRPSPGLNPRRETTLWGRTTRISRRTFPFTVNLYTSSVCLRRRTYATQFRCGKEVIRKERKSFTHAQGIRRAFLQSYNNGYYTASVVLIPRTLCSYKILTWRECHNNCGYKNFRKFEIYKIMYAEGRKYIQYMENNTDKYLYSVIRKKKF